MEMISAAHVDSPFSFGFRDMRSAPDPLLVLDDAETGYNNIAVLKHIALTIRPGERLGLLGRNGAGKSTLIKLLAGSLKPLHGKRIEGKDLNIGYFAQHQLEQLRLDESPMQHMLRLESEINPGAQAREQELRNYLGGFDFRGDMASSACGPFSGGEKSRLALALLIWRRPNLLLLDEPTNHLDLEMRHALTMALQEFEGGVVLVSHDRSLLRATCDRFMLVADGVAQVFDGDLDDYRDWLAEQRIKERSNENAAEAKGTVVSPQKNDRARSKAERQERILQRRPLIKETEQLETKLATWQKEKHQCDERLSDPAVYSGSDKTELQSLLKRQAELAQNIEQAEERWLELHELLEAMPAPD
jgi:ATP-binding cassette subfamily F protein 3